MDHSNFIVYGSNIESWQKEIEETTIDEYLVAAVRKRWNDILFKDAVTGESLGIEKFLQRSYSLAAELQALGCCKDTIVGIISENRLEYPIVILGTLLTGATLTCYDPVFSVDEFQPIFNIVQPTVLFCSEASRDKVSEVVPATCRVIVFDEYDTFDVSPHVMFSFFIRSRKAPSAVKNTPDQTAFILYSSGTTGLPKGVMLTHRNWVFMMKLQEKNPIVERRNDSMVAISTNMSHVSGLEATLSAINRDEVAVVMQKQDQRLLLATIQKYKIKHALFMPALIVFLIKDAAVNEYDLSNLESLRYGGAPIKPEIEQALKSKLNLKYIQQVYGMTETTLYITSTRPANLKVGTCGPPIPGTQIKIVDAQTGKILGKNQIGEMYVKGPHIMKGYYGNEKATAEIIDEDGWLHSGDIAYYDDDGDFFIVDRAKELIKCGGSQVSPAELEAFLLTNPLIVDVAVIGVPDENAIEFPRAYVVKKSGTTITEEEVIQYLAQKTQIPYKRLPGGVEFVSEIPRNPAGKILRRKLRELWDESQ